jgi:hypothetical protein
VFDYISAFHIWFNFQEKRGLIIMAVKRELIFKTDKLSLSVDRKGKYWIYDYIVGMNLAMRAGTERDAFIEVLSYYHNRLPELIDSYKALSSKVEIFIDQFNEDD